MEKQTREDNLHSYIGPPNYKFTIHRGESKFLSRKRTQWMRITYSNCLYRISHVGHIANSNLVETTVLV